MGETFRTYQSRLPLSASTVLDWHGRPGAFKRLTPAWAHARVVNGEGSINPGDWKTIRLSGGPAHLDWTIRHENLDGLGFRDVQAAGPFKTWRHDHRFIESDADASRLEDRLTYELPIAPILNPLAGGYVQQKLDGLFWFRHLRTQHDLDRHNGALASGPLRIAITGSSGLVGRQLVAFLRTGGHTVIPIVRHRNGDAGEVLWNPSAGMIEAEALEGCDAVVHLAGESIANGRWTHARKEAILQSRVEATTLLSNTLASLRRPPRVLVSVSAVGYYGDRGSEQLVESTSNGNGFLAGVCKNWEEAADSARNAGIRVVHPRFGIVIAGAGGMLNKLTPLFRLGAGGRLGNGNQYMSWIAIDDLLGVLLESITNERLHGPVNAVAPNPVTNREFTSIVANVLRRPALFPAPAPFLRVVLGQMADELLLASQRAVPGCLEEAGFRFFFPTVEEALRFELGSIDEETRSRFVEVARSTAN